MKNATPDPYQAGYNNGRYTWAYIHPDYTREDLKAFAEGYNKGRADKRAILPSSVTLAQVKAHLTAEIFAELIDHEWVTSQRGDTCRSYLCFDVYEAGDLTLYDFALEKYDFDGYDENRPAQEITDLINDHLSYEYVPAWVEDFALTCQEKITP